MSNRLVRRPRIVERFMYQGQPTCTFMAKISSAHPGKPMIQRHCSLHFEVRRGEGWLVYQQKDGDWVLAYLWPGQTWGAYVDHPYYLLPVGDDMTILGTCFEEQLNRSRWNRPRIPEPEEAYIYYKGEIIDIGEDWLDLSNEYTTTRIKPPEQDLDKLFELGIGELQAFHAEVNIAECIGSSKILDNEGFDPRILWRPKLIAGSDSWEEEEFRIFQRKWLGEQVSNT